MRIDRARAQLVTILLVDDELSVRRVTERALSHSGFHVLTAGGGAEALAVAQRHQGRIDLLISDVMMPEMSGRDLANTLRQSRPDCAVLLLSGGAAASDEPAEVPFLQKPFTIEELTRKISGILSAA